MIEIIYKDERQEKTEDEGLFSVPKNIRQIGEPGKSFRIYMEDYVYTFLRKISRPLPGRPDEAALAVLTGEVCWQEGTACLFIRGALAVKDREAAPEHIDFSEEVWEKLHEEEEKYFPGQEIVGWVFAWPQQPMEVPECLMRIHQKYFGGEKILFLMDPAEREESFFRYENSEMTQVRGYYIYYEKNQPMQDYMLDKKAEFPAETAENVDDTAVKAFRTIIKGKKKEEEPEEEPGHSSVFSYAAAACLVLAVAAVGTSVYRNYRELQAAKSQTVSSKDLTAVTDGTQPSATPAAETAAASGILDTVTWEETTQAAETAEESTEETAPATTELSAAQADAGAEETEVSTASSENAAADSAQSTGAADAVSAAETSQIYLEESDTRKAKRREAEADKSSTAQSETGNDSPQTDTVTAEADGAESSDTSASGSAHEMYVIRAGDTLYQISLEYYGNIDVVSEICSLNNLSENETIYPGQVIVLP